MIKKTSLLYNSNKDVIFSTFTQMWKLVSGPLNLILIPLFLSSLVQGFWYTFISLSALSVFADLGFTAIILQFSAHEFAFLKFKNGCLVGDTVALDRITSLFRFVIRWTLIMMLIVFPIIAGIGYYMFYQKSADYFWAIPWVIYLIAASGTFLIGVLTSFIQGLEQVAKVQRIILYSAVFSTTILVVFLILGYGLYALAFSLLTNVFVSLVLLIKNYHSLLKQLWQHRGEEVNWKSEIFSLLGRYAISWSSAYFIYNIYTPLMFQFHGSEEAGKVGITMSVLGSIFALSYVWINAKTPSLNIFVAEKKWTELDKLTKKLFIYSSLTYIFCIVIFFTIYTGLFGNYNVVNRIIERFLGFTPLLMVSVSLYVQMIIGLLAIYLRAHKQEPFMYVSLSVGLYILVVTYLSAKYLSSNYLFLGFLTGQLLSFYPAYLIFKRKRDEWH